MPSVSYSLWMIHWLLLLNVFNYRLRKIYEICIPSLKSLILDRCIRDWLLWSVKLCPIVSDYTQKMGAPDYEFLNTLVLPVIRIWKPLSTPAHKDTLDRPLYTYLHNHYKLYSFSRLGSHSDECRYQPLVLPCTTSLVRGTKTQTTNQLDDSQRITTVTAKSIIVQ